MHLGTLRLKLATIAAAGFVLTGLMTVLVLQTTRAAHEVVEQAQASHDRTRVFARLLSTANRLQRLTYDDARARNVQSEADVRTARGDFVDALTALRAMPQPTARERALVQTIAAQAEAVLDLFSHGREIVNAVDKVWRDGGSHAALSEVKVRSEPYRVFAETVSGEVERGDRQVSNATSSALAQQRSVQHAAFIGLALAFGLSVTVFVLLMTRLGPGLKRLELAARAFGSGQLTHRIHLAGHDELAQLATVLNSMAQEISEKQHALQESRAGLERAVATRTAELERANSALSAEDERRRTFLADASHELRIPLTIIRGEAQVAHRAGLHGSQDGAAEVFERILEQTRVLTRLLDDLFLIARAEAGGLRLNLCTLDLGTLVRRVAHDFSTIACESGATVHVEASSGLAARIDPDRVRQALGALVDNALRHTRTGVCVRVEARASGDWITITVADDGPGIDACMAAELFGRFRRGRTRGEGSGLGLTVVRALAEAHGGTASLANSDHGGARATLRLPRNAKSGSDLADDPVLSAEELTEPGTAAVLRPWGGADVIAAGGR